MPKINIFAWYNRLSSREQRVLQGAAAVVLLLLLDSAVFRPVGEMYVSLDGQIVEAEGNLTRNLVNLSRKEPVEAGYSKYSSFVRQAGTDEEENASLLSEIEQLARANQVVLVDMKAREAASGQFYRQFSAELDAEGEMKNLIAFMYSMEQSAQVMKVVNAKLTEREANSVVVKGRMTVAKTVFLGGI